MSSALLVASKVTKNYEHLGRTLNVLKGIDLTLDHGEMVGLVGKSGAGKSTLMHCLGTLDVPTTGSITLDGIELTTLSSGALAAVRNRTIGFVFQFHHLLPDFTAVENVMMPGMIQGMARTEIANRAKRLLEEMGLAERMQHRPGELSGGEQQRVSLARALVLEPKLVLADEPTGNLDTSTSEQIQDLFFDINRRHGTTIVVVTHNTALAELMPRVVQLKDGLVESDVRKPS